MSQAEPGYHQPVLVAEIAAPPPEALGGSWTGPSGAADMPPCSVQAGAEVLGIDRDPGCHRRGTGTPR